MKKNIQRWLKENPVLGFTIYTATVAFLLYTSVYGFRKTFSVATFEGMEFFGVSYKVWLVTAQVVGYALSKFIGIKLVSELNAASRKQTILLFISLAGIAWLLFALTPPPYNILFLFLNGLPLGMIWGLIFSYLEGRKTTDLLGVGLSVSFIFSSGFSKTVGSTLLHSFDVSEQWMPFVACCLFLFPLLITLWLLDLIPPPSQEDQVLRTKRKPMNAAERWHFLLTFGPGLFLLVSAYLLLTCFRDFRDNFAPELWKAMGHEGTSHIFTSSEIPIAITVLIVMGSLIFVRNNALALRINHIIVLLGFALIGLSTVWYQQQHITPAMWMILSGLGLYLSYVPFNCIFFDRLIAAFKYVGTVGFIMYVADSVGYLGSVSVLFYKEFGYGDLSWLTFFQQSALIVSVAGFVLMLGSLLYFERKLHRSESIHESIQHLQIPAREVE